MIDAGQFAKKLLSMGDGYFRFGIVDSGEIASVLRRMADDLDAGKILVQEVQTGQIATLDNYYLQAIMIQFAEQERETVLTDDKSTNTCKPKV